MKKVELQDLKIRFNMPYKLSSNHPRIKKMKIGNKKYPLMDMHHFPLTNLMNLCSSNNKILLEIKHQN